MQFIKQNTISMRFPGNARIFSTKCFFCQDNLFLFRTEGVRRIRITGSWISSFKPAASYSAVTTCTAFRTSLKNYNTTGTSSPQLHTLGLWSTPYNGIQIGLVLSPAFIMGDYRFPSTVLRSSHFEAGTVFRLSLISRAENISRYSSSTLWHMFYQDETKHPTIIPLPNVDDAGLIKSLYTHL